MQATQLLLNRLPPYEDLAAPVARLAHIGETQAGREEAVWVADVILATRMRLLMNLLGACLPALPQVTTPIHCV